MKKDKVVYKIEDISIGDTVSYDYDGDKDTGVVTRIIMTKYGDVEIWVMWKKDSFELYCSLTDIAHVQKSKDTPITPNKTDVIFCCYKHTTGKGLTPDAAFTDLVQSQKLYTLDYLTQELNKGEFQWYTGSEVEIEVKQTTAINLKGK